MTIHLNVVAVRVETINWIIAFHVAHIEVAYVLIDQGVDLTELSGIDPDDIAIMCSTARKLGGMMDDPMVAAGTVSIPQVPNTVVAVPTILLVKLTVDVTTA